MKSFKLYIKESLLDDEDDLANCDEELIISYLNEYYEFGGKLPGRPSDPNSLYIIENGEVSVKSSVCVYNHSIEHLTNGLFRFKYINGSFSCENCPNLKSLEGAPQYVKANFSVHNCSNLKSLEGGPQYVGVKPINKATVRNLRYFGNKTSITSLKGAPIGYVVPQGDYTCTGVDGEVELDMYFDQTSITTIDWGVKTYYGEISLRRCKNLKNLKGSPQIVYGTFRLGDCTNLTTLEGAPQKVFGDFIISNCNIKTFEGGPKYVKGDIQIDVCTNFTHFGNSLDVGKGYSKSIIKCYCLPKFDSFDGLPNSVRRLILLKCPSLESLEGCPTDIERLEIYKCPNLKSIGDWKCTRSGARGFFKEIGLPIFQFRHDMHLRGLDIQERSLYLNVDKH